MGYRKAYPKIHFLDHLLGVTLQDHTTRSKKIGGQVGDVIPLRQATFRFLIYPIVSLLWGTFPQVVLESHASLPLGDSQLCSLWSTSMIISGQIFS